MQLEVCANCEEVIEHAAVYADGHSYCCAGCGAGSPCACIYTDNEPSENLRPAGAASVLRFPRSDDRLIVVQISGFADQRQVIRLAEAMEVSPALADVTLACLAEGDAWLTTHAASADAVARVMSMAHADGSLDIVVNQNLVEARLVVSDRNTAPAMDTAPADMGESRAAAQTEYPSAAYLDDVHPASTQVPSPDDESVLPPRPRFRVFRPPLPGMADGTALDELIARQDAPMPPLPEPEDDEPEPEVAEYYIVATQPFRSFSAVNGYHSAIRALDGVKSTHVQRFDHGTLYLAVTYQSRVPLRARIERLDGYTLEVLDETHSKIDIALRGVPMEIRSRKI